MNINPGNLCPALGSLALVLLLCGCEYPQAGYYALVGVNHTGERVASWPFMIEELTDDSTMTTGFMLLLPRAGALIEVPISNNQDTSQRSWNFEIDTEDSTAGSLEISFSHYHGVLQFAGRYQATPFLEPWPIAGKIATDPRSAWLDFNGGLPYLAGALSAVYSFELEPISQASFEETLGCKVVDALRREPTAVLLEPRPDPGASPEQLVPEPDKKRPNKPSGNNSPPVRQAPNRPR